MAERRQRPRYARDSYGLVLTTVAVTIVWTAMAPPTQWAQLVVAVLQATMLFGALRASSVTGHALRIILAVWAVAAAAGIVATIAPSDWTTDLGQVLGVLLILAALVAILRRLAAQPTVEWNTVLGAISAYLMLGLLFAYAFAAVDEISPDPPLGGATDGTLNSFLYFSFITMASVGYGDIVPVTDLARSLTMTEAMLGQLYLVTVIAVLVSNAPRRVRTPPAGPEEREDREQPGPATEPPRS